MNGKDTGTVQRHMWRKRTGIVVLAIAAVCFALSAYLILSPQQYRAVTLINAPPGIQFTDEDIQVRRGPFFLQTEFEAIQSKSVLFPVIEELKLNQRWTSRSKSAAEPISIEEAFLMLKRQLAVRSQPEGLIEIAVTSGDRLEVAEIANAIVTTYQQGRNANREANLRRLQERGIAKEEAVRLALEAKPEIKIIECAEAPLHPEFPATKWIAIFLGAGMAGLVAGGFLVRERT